MDTGKGKGGADMPQAGEVGQDRRGKRRSVVQVLPATAWGEAAVRWQAVGPNHGQNEGRMTLPGWLRSGWRKVQP